MSNVIEELERTIKLQSFHRQYASALWSKYAVRMENEISKEHRKSFRKAMIWLFTQVGLNPEPSDFDGPSYHRFAEFGIRAVDRFEWKDFDRRKQFVEFARNVGLKFGDYIREEGL